MNDNKKPIKREDFKSEVNKGFNLAKSGGIWNTG